MTNKTKTLTIDPRIFINKPYIKCPKCNEIQFGVLMINRRSYVRKCLNCQYKESFSLPKISKKLIYMDQFAISEMMKSLNKKDRASSRVDSYWLKVFKKLDRLVKLQLIVCPESFTHEDESLVAGDRYKPLRRIYELLSNGVSFYDADTIKRFQIHDALQKWLGKPRSEDLVASDMTGDDIDKWEGRFLISVDMIGRDAEKIANQIRQDRERVSNGLKDVCEYWRTQQNTTFKEFYERERNIFGEFIIQEYVSSLQKIVKMQLGLETMDIGAFMSLNSVVMTQIHKELEESGVSANEIDSKTMEFLHSQEIKDILYVKISSMMYASFARQFSAGGRAKPLSNGMMNDITTIAAISPYCDAMFIDKECDTVLTQEQKRVGISLPTKFFSLNKRQEFLDYLDKIESEAGRDHFQLVAEVYGDSWGKPFVEVFQNEGG